MPSTHDSQRTRSPRNTGSDEPGSTGFPGAVISWSRPYARYPLVPVPRFPVHRSDVW